MAVQCTARPSRSCSRARRRRQPDSAGDGFNPLFLPPAETQRGSAGDGSSVADHTETDQAGTAEESAPARSAGSRRRRGRSGGRKPAQEPNALADVVEPDEGEPQDAGRPPGCAARGRRAAPRRRRTDESSGPEPAGRPDDIDDDSSARGRRRRRGRRGRGRVSDTDEPPKISWIRPRSRRPATPNTAAPECGRRRGRVADTEVVTDGDDTDADPTATATASPAPPATGAAGGAAADRRVTRLRVRTIRTTPSCTSGSRGCRRRTRRPVVPARRLQRGAGRPRLDPAGGQAAAPARLPGLVPAPPADPDRGGIPGPPGVRRAGHGGPATRRPRPGGAARGRHPGRALRLPDRVGLDDRQRLPGQGAERAAVDGGRLRRHRPRPQRGASTPARSTGTRPGWAARPAGSRPRCPAATPSWRRSPRTRSGTRAPG